MAGFDIIHHFPHTCPPTTPPPRPRKIQKYIHLDWVRNTGTFRTWLRGKVKISAEVFHKGKSILLLPTQQDSPLTLIANYQLCGFSLHKQFSVIPTGCPTTEFYSETRVIMNYTCKGCIPRLSPLQRPSTTVSPQVSHSFCRMWLQVRLSCLLPWIQSFATTAHRTQGNMFTSLLCNNRFNKGYRWTARWRGT